MDIKPIKIKCLYCGKEVYRTGTNQKYCSISCQEKYRYHYKAYRKIQMEKNRLERKKRNPIKVKEQVKRNWDNWVRRYPERYKKKGLVQYYKGRKKFITRVMTRNILKTKPNLIKKECNNCNSLVNLEIHHEIYPKTSPEIREAINNKKIYYLCHNCHRNGK